MSSYTLTESRDLESNDGEGGGLNNMAGGNFKKKKRSSDNSLGFRFNL